MFSFQLLAPLVQCLTFSRIQSNDEQQQGYFCHNRILAAPQNNVVVEQCKQGELREKEGRIHGCEMVVGGEGKGKGKGKGNCTDNRNSYGCNMSDNPVGLDKNGGQHKARGNMVNSYHDPSLWVLAQCDRGMNPSVGMQDTLSRDLMKKYDSQIEEITIGKNT